ncbi:MAG: metal ABC transporter permease [Betaproteobacteria bacterium]|jgi:zinc/manganese transport system permease protein|nr:metal ABC transporter permease [Betaproteobacteria bacterium]NDA92081.1 metal ABC transporter permease [Betaproteobacteria bacterium]
MSSWLLVPALALIAGVVALTPLGSQVLKRGVVFIDLAVAQAAAAAVIWVHFVFDLDAAILDQLAASAGAVGASLAIARVARHWSTQREALIGLIYVAAACMALLGASRHPHGREKLFQLLAADVLWVDATSAGILLLSALCLWLLARTPWFSRDGVFYAAFAVVVSVAVPMLGLFLVFASLIAPALWIERGIKPWIAMAMASMVCLLGLWGSWMLDTPSGPTVVLMLAAMGVSALFHR